jgi:hypothetical protein
MKPTLEKAMHLPPKSRFLILAASLAVTAALANWGGDRLVLHVYAETPINVRPYVMDYDNIVVKGTTEKVIGHVTESRRSDGAKHSMGIYYAASAGQPDAVFRGVDLPDGTVAFISDVVHAKSTARRPAADQARLNADAFFDRAAPGCTSKNVIGETVEGTDVLFGYSAVRISMLTGKDEASRHAGLSRVVDWRLPEFNCVIAQEFLQTRSSQTDEWKTTQGNRLTGLVAREPDPALFTNWLNYDEMKPSDAGRKVAMVQSLTPEACPKCSAPDPSDANYMKWRSQNGN